MRPAISSVCIVLLLLSSPIAAQEAARKLTPLYWFHEDSNGNDYLGYTDAVFGIAAQMSGEVTLKDCNNSTAAPRSFKRAELTRHFGPCKADPNRGAYAFVLNGKVVETVGDKVSIELDAAVGPPQTVTVAKDWFAVMGTTPKTGDGVVFVPTPSLWGKSATDVTNAFKDFKTEFGKPLATTKTVPAFNVQTYDFKGAPKL